MHVKSSQPEYPTAVIYWPFSTQPPPQQCGHIHLPQSNYSNSHRVPSTTPIIYWASPSPPSTHACTGSSDHRSWTGRHTYWHCVSTLHESAQCAATTQGLQRVAPPSTQWQCKSVRAWGQLCWKVIELGPCLGPYVMWMWWRTPDQSSHVWHSNLSWILRNIKKN